MKPVRIVGVGSAGCQVIRKLSGLSLPGVSLLACHTDFGELTDFPSVLLLGDEGQGSGMSSQRAKWWARGRKDLFAAWLNGAELVIFIAGMGGGTGSGATPVLAGIGRELGILSIACVTMPFASEGSSVTEFAADGLRHLRKHCDTVIAFSLDKLAEQLSENLTIPEFYAKADELLLNTARLFPDLLGGPLPLADMRPLLTDGGMAFVAHTTADGSRRLEACLEQLHTGCNYHYALPAGASRLLTVVASETPLRLLEHQLLVQELERLTGRRSDAFRFVPAPIRQADNGLTMSFLAVGMPVA
ncbi:MAG: hypothetical protein J7576_00130 [Siphonobacter aquaeclarae]|nr:hypothetical protein [Siphonobacter aquaeclarae]